MNKLQPCALTNIGKDLKFISHIFFLYFSHSCFFLFFSLMFFLCSTFQYAFLFLEIDLVVSFFLFPYVPHFQTSLSKHRISLFFPFVFHSFFLLFVGLFHFILSVGTLATGEDRMDYCYCFFSLFLFFHC